MTVRSTLERYDALGLRPIQKLVLLALAGGGSQDRYELAEELGEGYQSVYRATRTLESLGFVTIRPTIDPNHPNEPPETIELVDPDLKTTDEPAWKRAKS